MPNIEIYLCEKKFFKERNNNKLILDLHFFEPGPYKKNQVCNLQAEKMVRRTIQVLPTWLLYPFYISFKHYKLNKVHFVNNLSSNMDPHGLLDKYDCHFSFNPEELDKGNSFLKEYGLRPDSKFICLNVRDSYYLKKNFPNIDFSYHDYRDVDISIFKDGIMELLERGYFIFRVGKITNQSLKINHNNYVDLTNTDYDDFLDLFLGAKCEICITTSSGFDSTPYVFRKNIIYLQVPISHFFSSSKRHFIFTKYHINNSSKKILKIDDIFHYNLHDAATTDDFKSKNISLISPSNQEIKEILVEAIEYFQQKKNLVHSDIQKKFWNFYSQQVKKDSSLKKSHYHFESYFSEIQIKKLL